MNSTSSDQDGASATFGAAIAVAMCIAVLMMAWAAHAGEIADCAHDRFMEAYLSPKVVTISDRSKAADIAIRVCLGSHPSDDDRAEFSSGFARAYEEMVRHRDPH